MFIYKTTHNNGKYYIGRCSRKYSKNYLGSGKWVRSIKDKSQLTREILIECSNFEELCIAEETIINQHINDPMCMNWNNRSVGFATGDLNPSRQKKLKRKLVRLKRNNILMDQLNTQCLELSHLICKKNRSSEVNSNSYKIVFKSGEEITITNLSKWCSENTKYNINALGNGIRIRGYYKDIIQLIALPK